MVFARSSGCLCLCMARLWVRTLFFSSFFLLFSFTKTSRHCMTEKWWFNNCVSWPSRIDEKRMSSQNSEKSPLIIWCYIHTYMPCSTRDQLGSSVISVHMCSIIAFFSFFLCTILFWLFMVWSVRMIRRKSTSISTNNFHAFEVLTAYLRRCNGLSGWVYVSLEMGVTYMKEIRAAGIADRYTTYDMMNR